MSTWVQIKLSAWHSLQFKYPAGPVEADEEHVSSEQLARAASLQVWPSAR